MEFSADKWGEVKALFEAALGVEPAARQQFLVQSCADAELRTLLEKLLASHERAGSFLANPAALDNILLPIDALTATFQCDDVLASRFKIVRFIAKGGMGEVYEAEDLELREHVAIKTIHPAILQQPRSLTRFKREVHLARQVTHPNVCRIFDFFRHPHALESRSEAEEVYFVSMELLAGETLKEYLHRAGRMTTADAMAIVSQLASALGAAHNVGILHRDFKPGNIILDRAKKDVSVRAVVTDFGLACRPSGARFTETSITTNEPFGTPAYMSPEQIEGRDLTTASDIYALGLVMYEMVTGVRPFETDSPVAIAELIKRIKGTPLSPRQFVPELSPIWESAILKCMEYEPTKRFPNIEAVATALSDGSTNMHSLIFAPESGASATTVERKTKNLVSPDRSHSPFKQLSTAKDASGSVHPEVAEDTLSTPEKTVETRVPRTPRLAERAVWAIAIIALTATVAALGYLRRHDVKASPQDQVVRAFINPPEKTEFQLTGDTAGPVAVSPDGTKLLFSAGDFLWVRELKEVTSRRLEGTREAIFPFWSPDSRSIGFAADNKLKTLDILSGRLVTVCDAPFLRGASWGSDGTILFSPMTRSEIWRVAAAGGTPVPVTKLAGNHTTHRWPQFLPGSQHFLYFAANHEDPNGTDSAVYIASLDGRLNRPLVHSLARAEYAAGYLLYVRERTLVAQPFDLDKLELRQDATVLGENITSSVSNWGAVFSASQNGVLAYQAGGRTTETELRWSDRSGTKLVTLGTGMYLSPRLSPGWSWSSVIRTAKYGCLILSVPLRPN